MSQDLQPKSFLSFQAANNLEKNFKLGIRAHIQKQDFCLSSWCLRTGDETAVSETGCLEQGSQFSITCFRPSSHCTILQKQQAAGLQNTHSPRKVREAKPPHVGEIKRARRTWLTLPIPSEFYVTVSFFLQQTFFITTGGLLAVRCSHARRVSYHKITLSACSAFEPQHSHTHSEQAESSFLCEHWWAEVMLSLMLQSIHSAGPHSVNLLR